MARRSVKQAPIRNRLYKSSDRQRIAEPGLRPVIGEELYRSPFRRDYARLIHSPSFRRLQGKTQVFPNAEIDFFRNRLTHSLEVAQIAKSIAIRLNGTDEFFKKNNIDLDIVEVAGLAHDLGHPPFGHNGEAALDDCMRNFGGFEGNAQTFRIVSRLEKKDLLKPAENTPIGPNGDDRRLGLNLTFRTLAALIKYDRKIPSARKRTQGLVKGIYANDLDRFNLVKEKVCPSYSRNGKFKTIECSIMDLADDIAYSTYDLEDTFKADFLRPLEILSSDSRLLSRVASKVSKEIGSVVDERKVLAVLTNVFREFFDGHDDIEDPLLRATRFSEISAKVASNGYVRTRFTAELVSEFISQVQPKVNKSDPAMSKVELTADARLKVETLKHFTFEATIMHPRLRVAEQRGYEIVEKIFKKLVSGQGYWLLPHDCRNLCDSFGDEADRKRVVADFIAGMTDRYAMEFFGRMYSENPQTIFKPM